MQEETLINELKRTFKQKSQQSNQYKRALQVVQSIMQSCQSIPSFHNIANNEASMALFLFGSVFKVISKENSSLQDLNATAFMLIIYNVFPKVNISALKQSKMLQIIQLKAYNYAMSKDSSPLLVRLSVSVLSYTLNSADKIIGDSQQYQILVSLFDCSVQSPRSNILTKEASKLLCHLINQRNQISITLADHAKMHLITDLKNEKQLYLFNVKDIITKFPLRLVNDITYRVLKSLHNNYETLDEAYKIQTYFFLEKMVTQGTVTHETTQQVVKQMIGTVPIATDSGQIIYGYMQALSQAYISFCQFDRPKGNKYLSAMISIFQQFIIREGKIQYQATNILSRILEECVDRSLWLKKEETQTDMLDMLDFQQARQHYFQKVICMLKQFLSPRYLIQKSVVIVLCKFFEALDADAWSQASQLVNQLVIKKELLTEKNFRKIFHSIFMTLKVKNILDAYPISVAFNIAAEDFELNSNLWILGCLQKYDGQQDITTFLNYIYPVFLELNQQKASQKTDLRRQAYVTLIECVWRSLKVFCKKIDKSVDYQNVLKMIQQQLNLCNDNQAIQILAGIQTLCINLKKNYYESKIAEKIISHLAKIFNIESNSSAQILSAIRALSLIAQKSYLNRVFEKNITKLLDQKAQGNLNKSQNYKNNMKNLQILMSVSYGINFADPSVISHYRLSKQQIVVKLVIQLAIQTNQFQKKAFKFMAEAIPLMPYSFTKQVIDFLEGNIKIRPASKSSQLNLLFQIWKQLIANDQSQNAITDILQFVKRYLPQILIAMKENNKKARGQSQLIFKSIYLKIVEMELNDPFIQMLCTGFATTGSDMKLATLYALGKIVEIRQQQRVKSGARAVQEQQNFLEDVLELVLILLHEKRPQIYRAVVQYIRKYIPTLEKPKQKELLSNIITQLFTVDQQSKMLNRSILKHFLLRVMKKHDRNTIQKMIPEKDRKILTNAIKVENSIKKKKKKLRQQKRKLYEMNNKKAQQSDSQSDQNEADQKQVNGQQMDVQNDQQLKQLNNVDNLLLRYDLDEQKFHFVDSKLKNKAQNKQKQAYKNEDITFSSDGLMIVKQSGKRARAEDEMVVENIDDQRNEHANNYQNMKKKRKTDTVHIIKESADKFKAPRAGGDIQLKDKSHPQAFIQFNSKALNKRFKRRAQKVFDSVFQRKEGGIKGLKTRMLSR